MIRYLQRMSCSRPAYVFHFMKCHCHCRLEMIQGLLVMSGFQFCEFQLQIQETGSYHNIKVQQWTQKLDLICHKLLESAQTNLKGNKPFVYITIGGYT